MRLWAADTEKTLHSFDGRPNKGELRLAWPLDDGRQILTWDEGSVFTSGMRRPAARSATSMSAIRTRQDGARPR